MRYLVGAILRFQLGVSLLFAPAFPLFAQSSNRLWYTTYNGAPTPSADISVQNLLTDGSAATVASNNDYAFISQTNVPGLSSPYDVAVDPAMGKVYVLDNNLAGIVPEYIYSFDASGYPSQAAASKQIIYTMPVPAADMRYVPLLSGIAVDPLRHLLYFNQFDVTTATNSYLGRIDLTSSARSNVHSTNSSSPVIQTFHAGQIPGQGLIALDATNVYLGAVNGIAGNSGLYSAARDANGVFTQLVNLAVGDTQFTNGLVGGVAANPADHLIYYLTANVGVLNRDFDLRQNALWVYDSIAHTTEKISSGYSGIPDNLAVDQANRRYYFTLGRDGTGNASPTNYQAVFTGSLGSTNQPTLLYSPSLNGQDVAGQPNAGNVALQGIFVLDAAELAGVPASVADSVPTNGVVLAPNLAVSDFSSTMLSFATVTITAGSATGDLLAAVTNNTAITASYDTAATSLTLSGYDSLTHYQEVLRSITFRTINSNPTNFQRGISWSVSDGLLSSFPVQTILAIGSTGTNQSNRISISPGKNGWTLTYSGIADQNYVVQSATSLKGPWSDLSGILTAGANGAVIFFDSTPALTMARFYRVRTGP